jgi:sugar lactone lactonase YvrE
VLEGTTILDGNTIFPDNSAVGLNLPQGITVLGTVTDSIIVVDTLNFRVIGLWDIGTDNENISIIATEWAPGQPLNPNDLYIDIKNGYNLYVSDQGSGQVVQYINMQSVSPPPNIVAGSGGSPGTGLNQLNLPFGVAVDSHQNVIVADVASHRITFWPPNATNSTVIAGLGVQDSSSMGLAYPFGIALDERNSWLYVADYGNNRIQRYSLNDTWPCNGTTVAGGNGQGTGSNQLNNPTYIRISNKTGAMYIVDYANSRVQRWQQGASEGVTIAGDPNGNYGGDATMFSYPTGLALNANETLMYVTDSSNDRVQRFQLI